jgi:hypothetical protein
MVKAKHSAALILTSFQWFSIGNAAIYWVVKAVTGTPYRIVDARYMKVIHGFQVEGNPTIYKIQLLHFKVMLGLVFLHALMILVFWLVGITDEPGADDQIPGKETSNGMRHFLRKLGPMPTPEPSLTVIEQQIDAIPRQEFTIDDRKWRFHGHDLHVRKEAPSV